MDSNIILDRLYKLIEAHSLGLLGGSKMPEDEKPDLEKSSKENYMYFTLPMALNYQRNSYKLWESANKMYNDEIGRDMFNSAIVANLDEDILRDYLVKYKLALQPNKQTNIWKTLSNTIEKHFNGDIRILFEVNNYSVLEIKKYIEKHKKEFPYIGGNKIFNYWLYVLEQYTDIEYKDSENITVAPDTNVIQSSEKIGIINNEERNSKDVQLLVAERCKEILKDTDLVPIDIHTPMWLWSRSNFNIDLDK